MTVAKALFSPPGAGKSLSVDERIVPRRVAVRQRVAREQTVGVRVEHLHVGRSLDQHVDDHRAARSQVRFESRQGALRHGTVEEHQQPDGDDRVVVLAETVLAKIRDAGGDRQPSFRRDAAQALDRDLARIERRHRATGARRRQRQLPQAAAIVEHLPAQVRQRGLLERIEPGVGLVDLPLELAVEELDAPVCPQGASFQALDS